MRDSVTINTQIKKIGNGWFLPVRKYDKELVDIGPGDDLEVTIVVRRRAEEKKE